MPRGGSQPGERRGGRKKGSLNRKTLALKLAIYEGGITPLELMLQIMRTAAPESVSFADYVAWMELRFEAAKAAAPYCHSRMGASRALPVDPVEVATRIREAVAAIDAATGPHCRVD